MSFGQVLVFLESMDDLAVAIRLVMATLFGCLIGWERIVKRHNAGIKTFALVSLGSAVATALNIYLANLPGLSADVSRIPAGVVSGIGFLGAGTILVTGRQQIKGLILLHLSQKVEDNSKYMCVYVEVDKNRGVSKLTKALTEANCKISSMTKSKEKTLQSSDAAIIVDIDFEKRRSHKEVLSLLNELDYVNYVEEI